MRRGDVFRFKLPKGVGHEQRGDRFGVVGGRMTAVDEKRLGKLSGHLSPEELWGVDEALTLVLGLD